LVFFLVKCIEISFNCTEVRPMFEKTGLLIQKSKWDALINTSLGDVRSLHLSFC
jgi:hypothetical protein